MLGFDKAFFLEGADRLGANLELDLLAIDYDGLLLEVWLPDLLGVALREADVAAELLTLAGNVAFAHVIYSFRFKGIF
mgnify:CR=1 FL=1